MRGCRRFGSGESGQALVEFALVLPLFLLLLVGTMELGQAWRVNQGLTHAAREGARLSVIRTSTDASVMDRVHGSLVASSLDPTRAAVELRRRTATGTLDTVTVRYPYHFRLLGPVVGLVGGGDGPPGTVELRSSFIMRNE